MNGNYVLPLPRGSYHVGVEAVDGQPVAANAISFTTQIGNFFGQQNFTEEFFDTKESALEKTPGDARVVSAKAAQTTPGINIITNSEFNISNFGALNAIGFINSPAGRIYAVAFPAAQVSAIGPGTDLFLHTGLFNTFLVDASVVPVYAQALLTTGVINPDNTATIDMDPRSAAHHCLVVRRRLRSFFFSTGRGSAGGSDRESATAQYRISSCVADTDCPAFHGVSGKAPLWFEHDRDHLCLSFLSSDGGVTFTKSTDLNFRFSLVSSSF